MSRETWFYVDLPEDVERIREYILRALNERADANTAYMIRVHLEPYLPDNPLYGPNAPEPARPQMADGAAPYTQIGFPRARHPELTPFSHVGQQSLHVPRQTGPGGASADENAPIAGSSAQGRFLIPQSLLSATGLTPAGRQPGDDQGQSTTHSQVATNVLNPEQQGLDEPGELDEIGLFWHYHRLPMPPEAEQPTHVYRPPPTPDEEFTPSSGSAESDTSTLAERTPDEALHQAP